MGYLFVFTLGIVILNLLWLATFFGKHEVDWPHWEWISPHIWYIMYPSFFYQVYWWSIYFQLI